jgi:lipopolysaccharide export system permease protein
LLVPYLVSAIFLAILSFYLGNFLIPRTDQGRRIFKNAYMENLTEDDEKNLHIQIEPQTFAYVESFSSKMQLGNKFSLEKYNGQKLVYKLMSDRIIWDTVKLKWTLKNYYIREVDSAGQTVLTGQEMDTTIAALKPTDLYKIKERYEEMNFFELNEYIETEKVKGSIAYKKYEIAKHKRIAGPAAIIILTFIGVALSSRKVRGGIGLHLGVGIALTFSYILLMQVSTVFSAAGGLSPMLASWIPNFVFLAIGLYLLKTAPK